MFTIITSPLKRFLAFVASLFYNFDMYTDIVCQVTTGVATIEQLRQIHFLIPFSKWSTLIWLNSILASSKDSIQSPHSQYDNGRLDIEKMHQSINTQLSKLVQSNPPCIAWTCQYLIYLPIHKHCILLAHLNSHWYWTPICCIPLPNMDLLVYGKLEIEGYPSRFTYKPNKKLCLLLDDNYKRYHNLFVSFSLFVTWCVCVSCGLIAILCSTLLVVLRLFPYIWIPNNNIIWRLD